MGSVISLIYIIKKYKNSLQNALQELFYKKLDFIYLLFNVVSKSLNIRLYSSVQLEGCTKP